MQDTGTYVLQWQNQEDQTEFLPSISSHKAQLMYFYETLPSAHYRYCTCGVYFSLLRKLILIL